MRVGIITHAFQKPTIEDIAESVKASGIRSVQLDLASAGMESLPESLDRGACRRIREAFDVRGIEVAALMTTFNAIHPDRGIRYLKARFPKTEAWQISCVGKKDYLTPDGIRVAPAILFLSRLV